MSAKETGCCRLFVGIPVSEDRLKKYQSLVLTQLAVPLKLLTLTHPSDGHVTVCFIGPVLNKDIDALKNQIQQCVMSLSIAPFYLTCATVAPFPHSSSHLSAMMIDSSPVLMALNQALRSVATEWEVEPERHAFRPHVSLLRTQQVTASVPEVTLPTSIHWLVDRLCIYESRSQANGARYRVIDEILL